MLKIYLTVFGLLLLSATNALERRQGVIDHKCSDALERQWRVLKHQFVVHSCAIVETSNAGAQNVLQQAQVCSRADKACSVALAGIGLRQNYNKNKLFFFFCQMNKETNKTKKKYCKKKNETKIYLNQQKNKINQTKINFHKSTNSPATAPKTCCVF